MDKEKNFYISPESYDRGVEVALSPDELRKSKAINFPLVVGVLFATVLFSVALDRDVPYWLEWILPWNWFGSKNRIVPLVLSCLVFSFLLDLFVRSIGKNKKLQKKIDAEEKRKIEAALSMSSKLRDNIRCSRQFVLDISECIQSAKAWIDEARSEYKNGAFSPFWDAIEKAAAQLGKARSKINSITHNATEYHVALERAVHSFPAFPVSLEDIQDLAGVAQELQQAVRLGQTNFQFSNIWEHRRTRACLIDGFATLGEAVENVGAGISLSIDELCGSLDSGLARLVREQVSTRDALKKSLDVQGNQLGTIVENQHIDRIIR